MTTRRNILVLGAGSWGTALAIVLARNGHQVSLWGRSSEQIVQMRATGQNSVFLPGIFFPENLLVTEVLEQAVKDAQNIIIAVPSHGFRETLIRIIPFLCSDVHICWASKGLEDKTGLLLHQVAEQVLGKQAHLAVLAGPSFAREVAAGLPTAVTIAATSNHYAQDLVNLFHNQYFRPYTTNDLIGVQLGGAIKNVIAIAAGIADGLKLGANTRAALITRGLTEMVRFGTVLGGRSETFMGLAGLGDLLLTCTDDQSRNRRFGYALGQGISPQQAELAIGQVVEGIRTTREIYRLAQEYDIDMPIVTQVYRVLGEGVTPQQAAHALLSRELKQEAFQ